MNASDLSTKLKEARTATGLSQEALAQHSNISLRTIQRIEKGIVPRLSTLRILCDTLELDFSQFTSSQDNDAIQKEIRLLKRMNLLALIFLIVPLGTVAFPLLMWKVGNKLEHRSDGAGKIISFQIIWVISTFLLFFVGVFISNLITGNAGNGMYVGLLIIGASLTWNIVTVAKSTISLNTGNTEILQKTPNFF